MIGQNSLMQAIDKLIKYKFPNFIVITGPRGSGKKLIAKHISTKLNYPLVPIEYKIDSIRDMINMAYKQTEPILYLISDADKMSLGAKNSLLKVIEEPPNNAHFIMTLQTIDNTLPTIKSRCHELHMDLYTEQDINDFIDLLTTPISEEDRKILLKCCNNYGDIQLFIKYGVCDFYAYVKKVYNNIYKVQSANSFKICDKLDVKSNEDDKYDVELFLRTFRYIAYYNMLELLLEPEFSNQASLINSIIQITSNYIRKLVINGINKQSLLDMWILDIRKVWRQLNENR